MRNDRQAPICLGYQPNSYTRRIEYPNIGTGPEIKVISARCYCIRHKEGHRGPIGGNSCNNELAAANICCYLKRIEGRTIGIGFQGVRAGWRRWVAGTRSLAVRNICKNSACNRFCAVIRRIYQLELETTAHEVIYCIYTRDSNRSRG